MNRISFTDNPEQKELNRIIRDNDTRIIFCTGPAGVGKDFATLYTSYQLVREHKYEKILFTRNPVQLGEEMGFLAGDLGDKVQPFMACLYDTLNSIERLGGPLKSDVLSKIEVTPLAFLRGRNLDNCIFIVDEAQNLDLVSLKAILTRAGDYCKIILLGSLNQIDDKKQARKEKCDFQRVMECLENCSFIKHVELIKSMRSAICAEIDERLKDLK